MLKAWYFVWNRDERRRHKEQYYSMSFKCITWINGKARDHCEVVQLVVTVSKFGPAGTRHPGLIGLRMETIRNSVE